MLYYTITEMEQIYYILISFLLVIYIRLFRNVNHIFYMYIYQCDRSISANHNGIHHIKSLRYTVDMTISIIYIFKLLLKVFKQI